MATRDTYFISGNKVPDVERTTSFALRDISDRLDRQEGIRGLPDIPEEVRQFEVGDTRPSVKDHHLFTTKNTKTTTITHLVDGIGAQAVDIYFGDSSTVIDFTSGNLRSNSGTSWSVTKDQYMHAVYDIDSDLWYCIAWEDNSVSATLNRWQFVEFSGDRTLVLTDAFKMLKSTGSAAQIVTVPTVADVGWGIGDQVSFYQYGSGTLNVAGASGVTINTPSSLAINEQYGTMVIVMDDTDQWFVAGRMAAA